MGQYSKHKTNSQCGIDPTDPFRWKPAESLSGWNCIDETELNLNRIELN